MNLSHLRLTQCHVWHWPAMMKRLKLDFLLKLITRLASLRIHHLWWPTFWANINNNNINKISGKKIPFNYVGSFRLIGLLFRNTERKGEKVLSDQPILRPLDRILKRREIEMTKADRGQLYTRNSMIGLSKAMIDERFKARKRKCPCPYTGVVQFICVLWYFAERPSTYQPMDPTDYTFVAHRG